MIDDVILKNYGANCNNFLFAEDSLTKGRRGSLDIRYHIKSGGYKL